jgi:hypothetical protein
VASVLIRAAMLWEEDFTAAAAVMVAEADINILTHYKSKVQGFRLCTFFIFI